MDIASIQGVYDSSEEPCRVAKVPLEMEGKVLIDSSFEDL